MALAHTTLAQSKVEPEPLAQPNAEPDHEDRGPDYHLHAEVRETYTSNLFHEKTRRLDLFESETGRWERYEKMHGPEDFVTEPSLEAGVGFKLGKRRHLELVLGAEYAIHARNPIANYLSLRGEAGWKLGKRDSLGYEVGFVPKRFVKNYAYDGVPALGATYFQRGDRMELDNELSYRHDWSKRVGSEVGLSLNLKRFDAPFENRDSAEYAAKVASTYAPLRALEIELGFEFGITRTPHGLEYRPDGAEYRRIPVDRSHHDVEPQLEVVLDLPARFAAGFGFGARLRQFETEEAEDGAYFDRYDVRLKLEAEVSKGFGKRFEVALQVGYQDNDAHRADPGDDADEYGYQELTLGLCLALHLG